MENNSSAARLLPTKLGKAGKMAGSLLKPLKMYIDDMRLIPSKDLPVFAKYMILNYLVLLKLAVRVNPVILIPQLFRFPWLLQLVRLNRLMRKLCRGRSGPYLESVCMTVNSIAASLADILKDVFLHPERLAILEDMVPTDIARAMDLKPWHLEMMGILIPMIDPEFFHKYIDEAENAGINPDACSLPKATVGLVLKNKMPKGIAMVSSNQPCDAGMASYTPIEKEYGIPTYRLDTPHHFYNERAEKLFAEDLKGLIAFLEKHTPGRMDWNRLRDICEGRNRVLELEHELWDMIRLRPAPLAAEPVILSHLWHYNVMPGHELGVRHFENLVAMARKH